MWDCLSCKSENEIDPDIEEGQILECLECGAEYEVSCLDPLAFEAIDMAVVDDDDDADPDGDDDPWD